MEASPESEDDRADGRLHIRVMSNLVEFYKTQFRILWEWQGGPWALVKRLVITLVVSAIAFWLTAWLLPNITVDRFLSGVSRRRGDGAAQRPGPTVGVGGSSPRGR